VLVCLNGLSERERFGKTNFCLLGAGVAALEHRVAHVHPTSSLKVHEISIAVRRINISIALPATPISLSKQIHMNTLDTN
jgi:hypothetical protein